MNTREIGIVTWFDEAEGYGYIARKQGDDIYVHSSAIDDNVSGSSLEQGDAVEFTVVEEEGSLQANEVIKL